MKATRDGFGEELYDLVAADKNIIVLSADLSSSLKVDRIARDFPHQYVECGVSEQNMIGVAAGIAMTGKISVATSFATFNPGRNWEQIRVSVAMQGLPVKIIGSHAGLATGPDGATHQALEDLALMSVLPGMEVFVPADYQEARDCTRALIASGQPGYLRLSREPTPALDFGGSEFVAGRGRRLRSGSDATIVACGLTVALALEVADTLRAQADLAIGVVDLSTLVPLDTALLTQLAQQTHAIITIEEHELVGGLGALVAAHLGRTCPCILEMVGIEGRFGQSGSKEQLWEAYGLTAGNLQNHVIKALERKREWLLDDGS